MKRNGPILIIEDNPDDVLLICKGLDKAGFHNPVQTLSDGEEAIKYLKGQKKFADRSKYPIPALILLDLKMPRVDGFTVLGWIRARAEWKCLPVIVLSTSFYGPEIVRAYELGANSFLTKPSDFNEYMAAVRNLAVYWLEENVMPSPGPFVPIPEFNLGASSSKDLPTKAPGSGKVRSQSDPIPGASARRSSSSASDEARKTSKVKKSPNV